jgi:hypothetical protein
MRQIEISIKDLEIVRRLYTGKLPGKSFTHRVETLLYDHLIRPSAGTHGQSECVRRYPVFWFQSSEDLRLKFCGTPPFQAGPREFSVGTQYTPRPVMYLSLCVASDLMTHG